MERGVLQVGSLWRQPGWRPERHSFLMLFGRDHRRPLLSTAAPARALPLCLTVSVSINPGVTPIFYFFVSVAVGTEKKNKVCVMYC